MHQAGQIELPDLADLLKGYRQRRQALVKEQVEASAAERDFGILQAFFDFNDMSLSQQRVFIGTYVRNVAVYPPKGKGRQRKDLSRLEVFFTDGTTQKYL